MRENGGKRGGNRGKWGKWGKWWGSGGARTVHASTWRVSPGIAMRSSSAAYRGWKLGSSAALRTTRYWANQGQWSGPSRAARSSPRAATCPALRLLHTNATRSPSSAGGGGAEAAEFSAAVVSVSSDSDDANDGGPPRAAPLPPPPAPDRPPPLGAAAAAAGEKGAAPGASCDGCGGAAGRPGAAA